jgi:DNA polymerase-3 subunit alpha
MAKHREKFIKGAETRGVDKKIADQIFEQAAKFAGYGFNKGHAAAYAQVAYQTAYLKANYPVEFLAASMTLDIGNTDRLNIFRQEAHRLNIEVSPPDINRSEAPFSCDHEKGVVYYALAAIKGVGRQAMDHVVAVREEGGPFKSIADFARRIDPRLVNKRCFEMLVRAGAFDKLNPNRRQLLESSDAVLGDAVRNARERESGQQGLFGEVADAGDDLRLRPVDDWLPHERLGEEFSAIGFYLSGHPLDNYETALRRLQTSSFAQVTADKRHAFLATLGGTIIRKMERRGRNDQAYAFVSFSDATGMYEVMFFPETLSATRPLLEAGKSVLLKVNATREGDELKLRAISAKDLDQAAANAGEGMRIYLEGTEPLNAIAAQLGKPGKGIVTIVVPASDGQEAEIKLSKGYQVNSVLRSAIKSLPGVAAVESV